MSEDREEISVQYVRKDCSVKLLERSANQAGVPEPRKHQKKHNCRKKTLLVVKIVLPVCLIIAGPALTFFWLRHVEKVAFPGEHASLYMLADVTNLTLESTDGSSFTVTWEPAEGLFDYYMVEVTKSSDENGGKIQTHLEGSCAKGTIIGPDKTRITCNSQQACTRASFTLRTYSKGPPELISQGSSLSGIIMPGQAPHPPRNITYFGIAPSLTRLQWEPPEETSGSIGEYTVKLCENFTSCDLQESLSGCIERETPVTWLDFKSTMGTPYCVLVVATTKCAAGVLRSPVGTSEFRTPLFELPDVAHLRLVSTAENSFTATWKKPEVSFDYYRIQVSDDSGDRSGLSEPHQNGSCATGTIIHPDQTQVTCSPLQPCTKASFTVRTYASGPPELTSLGVTLHDIFIPGQDPEPPGSITIIATSPSLTRLQWTPPTKFSGGIQSYAVKVCEEFTSFNTQASVAGCTEHQTSANWLEFASTADTPYCVLASVSVQCGFNVLWSRPAVEEFRTPSFVLPDVVNLRLVSTAANSFTASWDRPEARFDYYTIEVLNDKDQGSGPSEPQRLGSCASGVIIHPNQTVVTCTLLEACAKATLIVRTFRSGPPALTSLGVSLHGIFVPGEDPPPPRGLTMISKSPSLSKIQWLAPGNVPGNLVAFTAKVCTGYFSCDAQQTGSGCMEYETSDTWVEFESTGDTSYCVQVNARVRCGLDDISSVAMTADFRTALFELPDVTNLTLVATGDRSFTVRWERPDVLFDYYRVEVLSNYNEQSPGGTEWRRGSSCAAGSIVHSDQTEVTCNFLETCTNVSFRLQTYRRGPPELASSGNILEGILITAEDPDPPRSVSVVGISSSLTRLQWDPPTKIPKNILSYTVKVCDVFSTCDGVEPMTGCTERETSHTWLEFESMPDTLYCALVSTSALCRGDVLRSRPVTEEFRTPVFEITDVSNLTLISAADNSFTVAWERPADHFDYYRIEAKGGSNGVDESIGTPYVVSCARGTILHPDQNRVVCSYFDSCSVVSFTVHAYIKGPPEITSQGVTLSDIFIPGQEPEPPKSITMVALAPSITRLQWESPKKLPASVVFYTVMMCEDFASCSAQKNLTGCIEHETFATWLEIETSVDTNYCVLLWATTRCGADLLRSRPEAAEFKTPMFVLPDVTNLRLESAGDHSFTATWQRPKALFDYYMIELASETDGGSSLRKPKQVGSCASGTIVHPNHTRVTCNLLEACSEASLTVRTYSRGPPELFSLGVTLHNVFIPGKGTCMDMLRLFSFCHVQS
ncbi:fibronectin-like [Amblyomma americanum]